MSKEEALLNSQIRFSKVRLIGVDGEQLGILNSREAQDMANEYSLDLVCISPNANPPVCKIMDYGKYRYQVEKRQKEAKKKQKHVETKEIKLSTQIAQNDINYKIKHAIDFFNDGKHVRFRIFLRGREISDPSSGFEVLKKVILMVEEYAYVDNPPKVEGRYINVLMLPHKSNKKDDKKTINKNEENKE